MPETEPWTLARVERDLPDLAGLARLHAAIERALGEHETAAGSLHPALATPPGLHWLQGAPLLDVVPRAPLAQRLAAASSAVAGAVAATSSGAARAVDEIVASDAFAAPAWETALAHFREAVWRPACPHSGLARFLVLRTLSLPARHLARAFSAPLPERWKRSGCPWCGVGAAASVARAGGGRTLLCVLCGGRWETTETLCPACGERDLGRFRVLASREAGPASMEACTRCATSIKVFSPADVGWGPPLALEVASVRLDLVAERDESVFRDPVALASLYPPA